MSATPTAVAASAASPSTSSGAGRSAGLFGMKPLTPVAPGTRTVLGIAFFVLFFGSAWIIASASK